MTSLSTPHHRIHITDIEAAINHWRHVSPSPDGITLCAPLRALATVYGLMVFYKVDEVQVSSMLEAAHAAWLAWVDTMPDTPCIAICSTSQGDGVCKGCGRTDLEVQDWPHLSIYDKRHVWRRITQEGTAWRFNKYAERAREVL